MGNKIAGSIAVVAGVLILMAGLTGVAEWEQNQQIVEFIIGESEIVSEVFFILILIASFGGLAVIAGGWLLIKNRSFVGKLLVDLGAGAGLIGVLIAVGGAYLDGGTLAITGLGSGFLGLVLSVVARMMVD